MAGYRWKEALVGCLAAASLVALGCGGHIGYVSTENPQTKRYHEQGMRQLANDQARQAVESFELALKIEPLFVPSQAHLGYAAFKLNQLDRAVQELDNAVENNPDYADSYNYLAQVYEAKKAYSQALEQYAIAIDTYPAYDDAYFNRARLYQRLKRDEQALGDFETAASIATTRRDKGGKILMARANTAAGLIYVKNGLRKDAKQRFQIAIDSGETIPEAHLGLGQMHALEEHWLSSILELHLALLVKKSEWGQASDYDRAKKTLTAVHKKAPNRVAKEIVKEVKSRYDALRDLSAAQYEAQQAETYKLMKRLLFSAHEIDKSLVATQVMHGRLSLDAGDIDKAGHAAQAAMKVDASDKDARFLLAAVYMARASKKEQLKQGDASGDWKRSETLLRGLRKEVPESLQYHNLLGVAYFRQEDLRKAEREWLEALRCEGSDARKQQVMTNLEDLHKKPIIKKANELNSKGLGELDGGRYEAAREYFKQALSYDVQYAQARSNLALTALEQGDLIAAQSAVKEALALDPDLHAAHVVQGRIYRRQKQYKRARLELYEARRLNGFDPTVHYEIARLDYAEKKLDDAEKSLDRAIAVNPDHYPSQVLRAEIYLDKDLKDRAETQLKLAIDNSKGEYAPAYVALGQLLNDIGRHEEAVQAAESAFAIDPSSPEPWLVLARAKQALDAKPEAASALLYAAGALEQQGELTEAVKVAKRAVDLAPQSSQAHDQYGILLAKTGRFDDSVRELRTALQLDEGNLHAKFNLATVYEEQGEIELAATCYQKVIEGRPSVGNIEDAAQVQSYFLPRFRRASLYQPGRSGPVKQDEAVRLYQECLQIAPPDLRPIVLKKLNEIR